MVAGVRDIASSKEPLIVDGARDSVAVYPGLQLAQQTLARAAAALGILMAGTAALLLLAMSAILFAQVIYRYLLQLPLPWSEEAARFCLIWFAMLASCVAGHQGVHFSIRWCVNWLPARQREIVRIAVLALGAAVLAFVAWKGTLYLAVVDGFTATATQLNMFWVYLAIPVGCGALAAIQLLELFDAVTGLATHRHYGRWRLVEDTAFLQLVEKDE
jgi:TRAP-type C4-dicarboxylate transport system permease small subunit